MATDVTEARLTSITSLPLLLVTVASTADSPFVWLTGSGCVVFMATPFAGGNVQVVGCEREAARMAEAVALTNSDSASSDRIARPLAPHPSPPMYPPGV